MVVGYPENYYGWIMSRTKTMDKNIYESIMSDLESKFNYDRNQFEIMIHDTKP